MSYTALSHRTGVIKAPAPLQPQRDRQEKSIALKKEYSIMAITPQYRKVDERSTPAHRRPHHAARLRLDVSRSREFYCASCGWSGPWSGSACPRCGKRARHG